MKMVCIKNDSKREIEIGKTYFVSYHENPKIYWVKTSEDSNKTIQCYKSDFVSQSEYRNIKINQILN
jgi:hypothetical protein